MVDILDLEFWQWETYVVVSHVLSTLHVLPVWESIHFTCYSRRWRVYIPVSHSLTRAQGICVILRARVGSFYTKGVNENDAKVTVPNLWKGINTVLGNYHHLYPRQTYNFPIKREWSRGNPKHFLVEVSFRLNICSQNHTNQATYNFIHS